MSNHRYKAFFLVAVFIFSFAFSAYGQKPKAADPNDVLVAAPKIDLFVKKSGYKYAKPGKGVWAINHDSGTILIGTGQGILVAFMTVSPKGDFNITPESMSEMLKLSDQLDHIKFVIDNKGNLVVRADARLRSVDQVSFNDTVVRIIDGYHQASTRLAPFLVKK